MRQKKASASSRYLATQRQCSGSPPSRSNRSNSPNWLTARPVPLSTRSRSCHRARRGEVIPFFKRDPAEAERRNVMPIKLTGMSEVTRNMEALKQALDAAVEKAAFDPANPKDVERAIREIEMKVDLKLAPYISSPGVREIAADLKDEYRKAI